MKCGPEKITDVPASFSEISILSDQAFKYGDGKKFLGYLGTNAEPLCVDF
jgi:hypothetical protein